MPPLDSSTMVMIATLDLSRYSNVVAAKSPKAKHSSRANDALLHSRQEETCLP